jgi:hypothetical protein
MRISKKKMAKLSQTRRQTRAQARTQARTLVQTLAQAPPRVRAPTKAGPVMPDLLVPFTKFEFFADLPAEIRLKIWKLAQPGPRRVDVIFSMNYFNYQHRFRVDIPILLHVCQESRFESLKKYKLSFHHPLGWNPCYFDFECDMLFLPKFSAFDSCISSSSSLRAQKTSRTCRSWQLAQPVLIFSSTLSRSCPKPLPCYERIVRDAEGNNFHYKPSELPDSSLLD